MTATIDLRATTVHTAPKQRSSERTLDVAFSLMALALLLPVMLLIGAAVWLTDGGSPFYMQSRIGQGGRPFQCLKFRSMCMDAEVRLQALLASNHAARTDWERDHKLKNDPRVTPIGRFLRRSSLDELPQLWNILKGEMSLVGPRPIVVAEIPRYGRYFQHYCQVKPGLTGLWQISGRSGVTYRRRVAMDVVYIRHECLSLYLRIIIATVPAVLFQRGAV